MLTNIVLSLITRNVSSVVGFLAAFAGRLEIFLEGLESDIKILEDQVEAKKKEAAIVTNLKASLPTENVNA